MKILTWNILHGGGPRIPWIALELLDHDADVICLTEFRPGLRGGPLRGVLADHGYAHQHATDPGPRRNGVLIAARTPIAAPREHGPKLVTVDLPGRGLALTVAHLPDARKGDARAESRKSAAWHAVLDEARTRRHGAHAVVGDLNTGRHRLDEPGATFTCTPLLGRLRTMGYRDAYADMLADTPADTPGEPDGPDARQATQARAFSWVSHAGTAFRLDHTWCSGPLFSRVRTARYLHGPRLRGLSDHAAMVVDLTES